MRLFLASYRFGAHADALVDLVGGRGARVAVVSNALDFIPAEARAAYARTVYDQMAGFSDLGLHPFDLDLRRYFHDAAGLGEALDAADLVWATGGNSFLLRQALRLSGLDRQIADRLAREDLAYGGYSAGAVVAGPDLRGLELMDPPEVSAEGYPVNAPTIWEGLGLISAPIVPHYRSDHPESADADRVAARHEAEGRSCILLTDAEVLLVRGEQQTILR